MASCRSSLPSMLPIVAIAMAAVMTAVASGLCPARCRCDDESLRVSCAYAGLEVVPIQLNPEIRHLDLSDNRVVSVHLTFSFYGNLESLDLSSNFIHTLGLENFGLQQNLIVLNVSNNAIRTLAKNALRGLTSLKELNLANNNISQIDEQAFKYTSELETLNLSNNSITSLPDSLLRNLHKIRHLILNENSLLEVPTSNLALAPSLEHLDLSDNLILELARDSLPSLPSLVSLNLSDNVIRSISDVAFDRLPDLLYLDLSGNNLTSVPTVALARLSILNSLVLNTNPLGSLDAVAFRNLFELKNLELNDCMITSVNSRAFADNVNLERISMDSNRELSELPARVLYSARYLKWVSLRQCNLATLQPTQFPVDGLSHLRVGGNPLVCNCSVHWLWNVIRAEQRRNETRLELDIYDIVCVDEEFAGKELFALSEGSLRCRLSPLYLSLSAAGCLAVAATMLVLIAHLTRAKRKRRALAYTAPTRPEFLVYVGRDSNGLDKSTESYSRRLLTKNNEDISYDSPRGKTAVQRISPQHQDANIYETPRYAQPGHYDEPPSYGKPSAEEGVYAVADVTDLRDEPPEMMSLYRAHSSPTPPKSNSLHPDYGYGYDYDYEYDYESTSPLPPPVSEKPHVVFV